LWFTKRQHAFECIAKADRLAFCGFENQAQDSTAFWLDQAQESGLNICAYPCCETSLERAWWYFLMDMAVSPRGDNLVKKEARLFPVFLPPPPLVVPLILVP
jgi:hypothetical protein